jgi:hypothetical protein
MEREESGSLDPMGNFFSALAIVWRRTLSALSLRVLA